MFSILKKLNVISQNSNTISKAQKNEMANEDSTQNIKGFCIIDDFIDITKESFNETVHNLNKKEKMKLFSKEIISIILDSRKDNNKNTLLNDCKKNYENSFNIDIDELFLYDNLCKEKNDIEKFTLEFYLTKNKKDKIISELIEKWKFSYKLNNDENYDNFNIHKIKKSIILLKKSIINYTRLLPLYHYMNSKDKNGFSIEFKFYHNKIKNKGVFLDKDFRRVSFINKDLFSFKLNIKYISRKEINNIINESNNIENALDILYPEITNKIKSLSFHKSKPFIKGFEIINYLGNDNNLINEKENFNQIKVCQTQINNDLIKDIDLNSSSSSLYLNICDEEIENYNNRNISFNINKKEKENKLNLDKEIENISKRKCSTLSNSNEMTEDCTPRNNESKMNEIQQIKKSSYINKNIMLYRKDNKKINNIIKEYTLILDMIKDSSKFGNIKINKLIRYKDSFE